jgi:hypothetical protein
MEVFMQNLDFFEGIKQSKVQLGPYHINSPVFYRDMSGLSVYLLAPLNKVRNILPSNRMHPFRVTPWHSVVMISAFEYRDSDLGPYNEVSIGIPFVLDSVSPLFTGLLWKTPEVPLVYVHHLPVTTEMARVGGIEIANFPKFLAKIRFDNETQWISCKVDAEEKNILTLSVRKVKLRPSPRQRLNTITHLQNRLLRLEFNLSECEAGFSKSQSDIRLELGNHPIGLELRELNLGRMLTYQYSQALQAILTGVNESYVV